MPDTQYFTNIDGKYVKDAEARQQLNDLEDYVESLDQPWQPLQDGYSNFWFELTEDTLSPWLNFSAKTENAVIDWGDGSGEVALDTLTPTHTYSKAGRYVVKVKGVISIGEQHSVPYQGKYLNVLKYFELNSEVTSISQNTFQYCVGLLNFSSVPSLSSRIFRYCASLQNAKIPVDTQLVKSFSYGYCYNLQSIIIPTSVSSIESYAFVSCVALNEIHVLSNTPPTLGTSVFDSIASDYIIYVPVGTGDTYKSAAGWSTYADHILEEGQTPNRAMLAKFNSAKTDEPQDDMR